MGITCTHLNWSSGSRLNPFPPPPPPKRSAVLDCEVITDDANVDAMEEEVRMELAAVDGAAEEVGFSEESKAI